MFKNCSALEFEFDIGVAKTGIVLESVDDVLLSTGSTEFPMIFKVKFPKMDVSLDPSCSLSTQSQNLWKEMHKRIITSLAGQMHEIVMGNHTESELNHWLELLMANNNRALASERHRREQPDKAPYLENSAEKSEIYKASATNKTNESHERQRRSFRYFKEGYWLHSSWTEDKFDKISVWSENHFQALNKRIDNNGIALNITLNSLKNIETDICRLMSQNWESAFQNLRMSLLLSLGNLLELIKDAKVGIIPGSIPDNFFADFCIAHFRPNPYSDFCSRVNVRTLFNVKLQEVIIGENLKIGLKMKVNVPNTDRKPHKIFRIRTIPVFSGLSQNSTTKNRKLIHRALIRTPIKYVGVQTTKLTTNFEGLVGFESSGCINLISHHICFERALESDERCLEGLLVDQQLRSECQVEHAYSKTSCISRRTPSGTIISTLDPVEVHSHLVNDLTDSVFQMKAQEKVGVFFLKKHRNYLSMVVCDKKQIKVEPNPELKPIILETKSFNMSLNWKVDSSDLHSSIAGLEHQLIENKKQDKQFNKIINEKVPTPTQWENHFGLPFYDSLKLVVLGCSGAILIAITVCLIIKIYRKAKKQQGHEHHIPMNPTAYHEAAC